MYNNRIETFTLENGITIETFQDELDFCNPRETNDNLGTMVCKHPNYNLGDIQIRGISDYPVNKRNHIFLPLYLYDHSGLAMFTERKGVFQCPWDTSRIGVIFVPKTTVRKEYNSKRITKKIKDTVVEVLKGEVEEYSNYLAGNVFGFTAYNADGDVIDSCGGYICDYDDFKELITEELSEKI